MTALARLARVLLVGAFAALPVAASAAVWDVGDCRAQTVQDGVSIELSRSTDGSMRVWILVQGGSAGYAPGEMMPMLTEFPDGARRLSTLRVAYADDGRVLLRGDWVSDAVLERLVSQPRLRLSLPGAMSLPVDLGGAAAAISALDACFD